jgi:sensor domain CHASE-containing protein
MKLRKKVLFLLGSILVTACFGLFFIAKNLLLSRFDELELREGEANLGQLKEGIKSKFAEINSKVRDWAWWDDSANFVKGSNPGYSDVNMTTSYFPNLGLHFMIFVDAENRLIGGKKFDSVTGDFAEDAEGTELLRTFLAENQPGLDCNEPRTFGFFSLADGIVLTAASPVCYSNGLGAPAGKLLFARLLDATTIDGLAKLVGKKVEFFNNAQISADPKLQRALNNFALTAEQSIEYLNPEESTASVKIAGIKSEPLGIFQIQIPRSIHLLGNSTIRSLLFTSAFLIIVMALVMLVLLDRMVLRKVSAISKWISRIDHSKITEDRLPLTGHDELGDLSLSINEMLSIIATINKTTVDYNSGSIAESVGDDSV